MSEDNLSKYQTLHLYIVGASAAASLIVAGLALFGTTFRRWIYGPRLSAHASSQSPFIEQSSKQTTSSPPSGITWVDIRLKIINDGRTPATDCKVLVNEIFEVGADGNSLHQARSFVPTTFPWADDAKTKDLLPMVPAYVTIARIEQLQQTTSTGTSLPQNYSLNLLVDDNHNKGNYYKMVGKKLVLPVIVFASNYTKAQNYYVEISWQGCSPNDASDPAKLNIKMLTKQNFENRRVNT